LTIKLHSLDQEEFYDVVDLVQRQLDVSLDQVDNVINSMLICASIVLSSAEGVVKVQRTAWWTPQWGMMENNGEQRLETVCLAGGRLSLVMESSVFHIKG